MLTKYERALALAGIISDSKKQINIIITDLCEELAEGKNEFHFTPIEMERIGLTGERMAFRIVKKVWESEFISDCKSPCEEWFIMSTRKYGDVTYYDEDKIASPIPRRMPIMHPTRLAKVVLFLEGLAEERKKVTKK